MVEEIKPDKIYTPKETRDFLKISDSTMKRMLKSGIIEAYKVSGQYRIWGREILRLVSPEAVVNAERIYLKTKTKIKKAIESW
jgi:excisionase family DNA binding protein